MDPVYISFTQRDERKPKPQDPNNPTPGEPATRKWLKYYLVDEDGNEVLAATGEDQGDAHYKYHNAPEFTQFGSISFHNRKELMVWLEGVIRQSQGLPPGATIPAMMASGAGAAKGASGPRAQHLMPGSSDGSMDPAAAAALAVAAALGAGTGAGLPGAPGLPTSPAASPRKITPTPMLPGTKPTPDARWPAYASHRQEKFHHDDGRRAVRFYLVDKSGASTLAVSGDERDNKDGHYIYRTEITLPGMSKPKGFNNMADINRWLEAIVQSCGGTVPFAVDMSTASPKAKGRLQNKRSLDVGGTGGGHTGRLGGAAEAAHAKRLKALREETDPVTKAANENYLLSLRQAAKATASKREAALKSAQLYLKGVLPKEHQEALKAYKATLKAAADRCNPNKPLRKREARTAPPMPPLGTLLEALREVGGLFLPLCEIYSGGLVDYVQRVQAHQESAVADLAANVLGKWRSELAQQLGVLLDPSVLVDPCSRLEAAIRSIPPRAPPPRPLAPKTPRTGAGASSLALLSPAGSTPRLGGIGNSSARPTPRGGGPTPASIFKVPPPKFDGSGTPSATPVGMAAAPPGASRPPSAMATLGNPSEAAAAVAAAPGTAASSAQAKKPADKRLSKAPRSQGYADKTVPSGAQQQGSPRAAQKAAAEAPASAGAPSPTAKAGDKTLPGGMIKPSFGEKRRPAVAPAAASDDDDDDDEMEDEDDEDGGIGSPIGFGELEDMDEDDD